MSRLKKEINLEKSTGKKKRSAKLKTPTCAKTQKSGRIHESPDFENEKGETEIYGNNEKKVPVTSAQSDTRNHYRESRHVTTEEVGFAKKGKCSPNCTERDEEIKGISMQTFNTSHHSHQTTSPSSTYRFRSLFESFVRTTPFGDSYATATESALPQLFDKDKVIHFLTNPMEQEKIKKAGLLLSRTPIAPPLIAGKACFAFFVDGTTIASRRQISIDSLQPWSANETRPKSKRYPVFCENGVFRLTLKKSDYHLVEYSARLPRENRLRKRIYYIVKDTQVRSNLMIIYNYECEGNVPGIVSEDEIQTRQTSQKSLSPGQENHCVSVHVDSRIRTPDAVTSPWPVITLDDSQKPYMGNNNPVEEIRTTSAKVYKENVETSENPKNSVISCCESEEEKRFEFTNDALFTGHQGDNDTSFGYEYGIPMYHE